MRLGLYLKEHFSDVGDEKVDLHSSLSILRTKSTSISEIANTSDEARDAMLRYMVQLKRMAGKFPVSESQSGVQLSFEWGDAFFSTKKVGQYSLYYELGSVMFNYVVYSFVA